MQKTVWNYGDGPTQTTFGAFQEDYDLLLLTIKVQCPKCGHAWGIKIDDYNNPLDIPEKKFVCSKCK